jgi:hypothetical protein
MDKRLKVAGITGATFGLAALAAVLAWRYQPASSPLRSDLLTLVNDVGERIVVPKAAIRADPKAGKELLKLLAESASEDLKNASKPISRDKVASCLEAKLRAEEAKLYQQQANLFKDNVLGESIFDESENNVKEAMAASAKREAVCQKELLGIKRRRDQLRSNSGAFKKIINLSGTPGAYAEHVPTYTFKILVTDVNGKSNVTPIKITCLNPSAIYLFTRDIRKKIAPYAFVAFNKPEQMTIVMDAAQMPDDARQGGAILPTQDAINYAAQEVCKYKGHSAIEEELLTAKPSQ